MNIYKHVDNRTRVMILEAWRSKFYQVIVQASISEKMNDNDVYLLALDLAKAVCEDEAA